jgi:nitrogen fixation/metabolism regulation signal transduction histidine kinase
VSRAKITTLQNAQLGIMVIGVALVLLTIIVASKIGSSIARLQKAAEEISLGGVKKPVEVGGIGELRDLSAAFERMRVSLALAVEQLGGDDDDDNAGGPVAAPLR